MFIQTLIVNELPFTQAAIKQEKNVDNYKNRILQNKNQLKLLISQMWMVKNNQKHLKKELQFYLIKSLFKKNKKKTSAKIDAK